MSKSKWREEQSIPKMSHFSKQFTRNYFYWSRQKNTSVLGARQNREDWFAGASGTSHGSPCQTQPFPTQHQVHQMCHQHREMPSLPRGKGCCCTSLLLWRQHLSHAKHKSSSSPDTSATGTSLPLCPPASPRSPLLDALLLSGSGSADPGLASCVKDQPLRSKPPPQLSLREYD